MYTDDDELAVILASLRDWGRDCTCPPGVDNRCGQRFLALGELPHGYDHKYVYSHFGYNLRATDLQAAVGCAQLERLEGFTARRRANHARLGAALAPLADLRRAAPVDPGQPAELVRLPADAARRGQGGGVRRDAIVRRLEADRIQTRMLFAGNMVRQPCFDGRRATGDGYRVASALANTDRLMNDAFWVGVYPGLTDEMIDYIAAGSPPRSGGR